MVSSNNVFCVTVILAGYICWTISTPTNMYDIACRDFEEIRNTSECKHGARNNVCDKLACLKGAGEVCGDGLSSVFNGVCADKLMCCGICVGCYRGICSHSLCPHKRFTKRRHAKLTIFID